MSATKNRPESAAIGWAGVVEQKQMPNAPRNENVRHCRRQLERYHRIKQRAIHLSGQRTLCHDAHAQQW